MPEFEVCLTPDLLHLFDLKNKTVVVVDIFRATSCMVTAFAHNVGAIIPVAKVEECKKHQQAGLMAAAERDGLKIDGFDLDNSPFSYMDESLKDKTIAVTTTNGTYAITKSVMANEIVIGAFLNLEAVARHLLETKNTVTVVCSGWKGNFNIEDTLFAGALASLLENDYEISQDAAIAALTLYNYKKDSLLSFVNNLSHVKRLSKLNITKDIAFCLEHNKYDVVPVYNNGRLERPKKFEFSD